MPKQVFCHGQLYVALSRVTNREGLKVFIDNTEYPSEVWIITTLINMILKSY